MAFGYMMASESRTIYTGVTSNLEQWVWQHKNHFFEGFTREYEVTRLVYIAEFVSMADAIAWEKWLKGKKRYVKVALIEADNPRWNDLAWDWFD
jgi:putative endonuclease